MLHNVHLLVTNCVCQLFAAEQVVDSCFFEFSINHLTRCVTRLQFVSTTTYSMLIICHIIFYAQTNLFKWMFCFSHANVLFPLFRTWWRKWWCCVVQSNRPSALIPLLLASYWPRRWASTPTCWPRRAVWPPPSPTCPTTPTRYEEVLQPVMQVYL